nr:hypothetical protein [Tanacetum cinerariifolium]
MVVARLVEFKNQEIKFCKKIRGLEINVESKNNRIERLTNELEELKKEKEGLDRKVTGFQSASKDLDTLIGSQRSDKNKEGLRYSAVPPPAQAYSPPKKDMSWTGSPEFKNDTITDYSMPSPSIQSNSSDLQSSNSSVSNPEESSKSIISKPMIKFVKAADSPTVIKSNKTEIARKSPVKYAEMYKNTTKSLKVRGNKRNWNNLMNQRLEIMKIPLLNYFATVNAKEFIRVVYFATVSAKVIPLLTDQTPSYKRGYVSFHATPPEVVDPYHGNNKWYQSLLRSFDQKKNNTQTLSFSSKSQSIQKMVKSSSSSKNEVFDDSSCSKSCKKNTDSLNTKITELSEKLSDSSKDLDTLIGSQRSDKNKEGLRYSVVPPPAQAYSPPKKDMSWTGSPEFKDDTITDYSRPSPSIQSNLSDLQSSNSSVSNQEESSESIISKPMIKFVKAADSPTVIKSSKTEIARKSPVKYAEMYKNTTKSLKVRGNQRNWNNLMNQRLESNFEFK